MGAGLILQGTFANLGGEDSSKDVDKALSGLPGTKFYRQEHAPGVVYGAMFDWMLLLEVGGAIGSVGSALYLLYEKVLKSKPERQANSFLLVQLKHPNGTFRQFTLRVGSQTHESFLKDFERAALELLSTAEGISAEEIQRHIESSGGWVKVSKYDL